jgi:cell division protein FtsN|tara:strand:+ start:108 stop:452 length:345 start_codon:yes stop_codon:yes gene_type:complete
MKRIVSCGILKISILIFCSSLLAEDNLKPANDNSDQWIYHMQVGAFKSELEAKELITKLTSLKLPVQHKVVKNKWHRVLTGPYLDTKIMSEDRKKLSAYGFDTLLLRRKVGAEK